MTNPTVTAQKKPSGFERIMNASDWQIFLICFSFPFLVAVFVQFIFLPYIAPAWNAGHGLLVGLDSVNYHQMAVELAQKIHQQGWSAWTLHTEDSAHFGLMNITAAIYALTIPQPWVLIPLNAFLHGLSAFLLFKIFSRFVKRSWAIAGMLPFLIFPSAAMWYTQILKDTYSIAGAFLIFAAWVDLIYLDQTSGKGKQLLTVLKALLFSVVGSFLNWIVRPHNVLMLQALTALVFAITLATMLVLALKKQIKWTQAGFIAAMAVLVLLVMTPFTKIELSFNLLGLSQPQIAAAQSQPPGSETAPAPTPDPGKRFTWYPSKLPGFIDNLAYEVADYRHQFTEWFPWQKSGMNLDTNFESVSDMLAFVPRALLNGFLAPFPAMWFGEGSLEANTFMRRESAFEMIFCYLALLGLPYALWHWRKERALWVLFIYCLGMITFYGLVVSNAGAIYRYRYGFYMPFVGLGIMGWLLLIVRFRKPKRRA